MSNRRFVNVRRGPVADERGLFRGLGAHSVEQFAWQDQTDPSERGTIWTATDADGIGWVSDGAERIAALPARMFRFFRRGIAARRRHLLKRYLKQLVPVPNGAAAINFGANIGEIAITLAELGARVLAIEPDPNVVPLLRANARGRRIEVLPIAAWDREAELRLHLKSDSADSSVFNVFDESVLVRARPIDDLVQERGIERVDLLLGDAEGAEPEVLAGARQTLNITRYVSVCASAERRGEHTLEACEAILRAAGFEILCREETGFCMLIGRNDGVPQWK